MNVSSAEKLMLLLILGLVIQGCGRIWGSVTWQNGNGSQLNSNTFNYTCTYQGFLTGTFVNSYGPIAPGSGLTYSISPALPTGLSMNSSTGVISGTPAIATPSTAYTITASASSGSATATIHIQTDSGYLVNDLIHDSDTAGAGCTSAFATCTIRAAIDSPSPPNLIILPAGSTILSLGQMTISHAMSIYGDCSSGTTIDGNNTQLIFRDTTVNASFNNMTIQNGFVNNGRGVALFIQNAAVPTYTVTMNNVTVQHNIITGPGPGVDDGAGIYIEGNSLADQAILNLNSCTFFNNQDNSANFPSGGAIAFHGNFTQATINNSSFIQNNSSGGGAIFYTGNSLSITNSLFYNNSVSGSGGAIDDNAGATGNINLTNDTFDSNSAGNAGGAIAANAINYNVANCTFANNSTPSAGNGGAFYINGGNASVGNSLFLNNLHNGVLTSCHGATSTGGNLTDTNDCGGGDILNTVALLGALQSNGGPTQTMALLLGSPGINQAIPGACPATDQRGDQRHTPTSCDVGAYEHEP